MNCLPHKCTENMKSIYGKSFENKNTLLNENFLCMSSIFHYLLSICQANIPKLIINVRALTFSLCKSQSTMSLNLINHSIISYLTILICIILIFITIKQRQKSISYVNLKKKKYKFKLNMH